MQDSKDSYRANWQRHALAQRSVAFFAARRGKCFVALGLEHIVQAFKRMAMLSYAMESTALPTLWCFDGLYLSTHYDHQHGQPCGLKRQSLRLSTYSPTREASLTSLKLDLLYSEDYSPCTFVGMSAGEAFTTAPPRPHIKPRLLSHAKLKRASKGFLSPQGFVPNSVLFDN